MNGISKDTQEVLSELVRAGLWEGTNLNLDFNLNNKVNWEGVYQLAQEQSVLGLVLAGLERYKNLNNNLDVNNNLDDNGGGSQLGLNSTLRLELPSQMLLLQWIGEVQLIEQQNLAMNRFVAELIERLRMAEIDTLLLKGQGIAQCYEKPLWRCCGDVDLFLREDNYNWAKELLEPVASALEKEYVREKHLGMTINGFTVELHGTLHCGLSSKIEKVLDEIKKAVFHEGKVRSWMNGNTQIFLPNTDEDVVYVFTHMLQHFFKEGLGLRQVCDWCRLLYRYRSELDLRLLESRIRRMGLLSEWKAFAAFAVEYLGMPVEAMPFINLDDNHNVNKKDKKKADKICAFILEVGNMGHNRDMSYFEKYPYLIRKMFSMGRRCGDLIRHARIFPMDSIRFFPRIMFNGLRSAARGE